MRQGSLTSFGMTLLVEWAQCAAPETGVIAGGVTPALERSEGSFTFLKADGVYWPFSRDTSSSSSLMRRASWSTAGAMSASV